MNLRTRVIALLTAVAVSSGAVIAPTPAFVARAQETCNVDAPKYIHDAKFDWGLRSTWTSYITNQKIARGTISSSGGVTFEDEGPNRPVVFSFDVDENAATLSNTKISLPVSGTWVFKGHEKGDDWVLDDTFSNLVLEIEGSTATIYADVHFREFIDTSTVGPWKEYERMALSTWTLKSAPKVDEDGIVTFESNGRGRFVDERSLEPFATDFYVDNPWTDPISGTFTVATEGCPLPTNPQDQDPGSDVEPGTPASPDSGSSAEDLSSTDEQDTGFEQIWSKIMAALSVVGALAVIGGIIYRLVTLGQSR